MMVDVKLSVPKPIYGIYADAAKRLRGYSVEDVLSAALQAYAQYLLDEMMAKGEPGEKG